MKARRVILSGLFTLLTPAVALCAVPPSDRLLIPNSSFEEPDNQGNSPRGWEFHGPPEALAAAWTGDTPFEGNRALRIDARRGSHRWQSTAIELPSHREYLLLWKTRFHGEKIWRFRAVFCGVEVVLQDGQDHTLHTVRTHSNCWQTLGWQSAWLHVAAPDKAKSMIVRFGIETDDSLPGGFDVDSVELVHWPQASTDANRSCLSLRVRNENGLPTAARLRVVSSQGTVARATGGINYQAGGAIHPLDEGACQLFVPPDTYEITATKGFEYLPWRKTVRVGPEFTRLDVELQRAWNWNRRGWYCGDHHTHLHRHGGSLFPMLTWRDVMRAARCEGLNYLPFMGADLYPTDADSQAGELQRPDFVAELGDEITDDLWGHVCPIGVLPERRRDPRYDKGPMNFDQDVAIANHGVLCYAHPYGALHNDSDLTAISELKRGHVAREFPIDLALGMQCGIDVLTMEGDRNRLERKLKDVYRLYNLGFRPAMTASTDFHIDQARQPIGAVRTYVRCSELSMTAIAAAHRAGRTFATNGPLIDLKVGDAAPGDEIALADGKQSLPVSVEAVSIGALERVEIIVNGQTAHTMTSTEPHRVSGTLLLPVRESLWVAARAVGSEDSNLAAELEGRKIGASQYAHTSPVYVLVEGRPILAAQQADAQYFAHWCEATLEAWRAHILENPSAAENDQLVRQRIDRARGVFLEFGSLLKE